MMYGEDYVLPQHLYANLSLKVLELMNCVVAPVGIVGWKSLKRLFLKYVRLSDDVNCDGRNIVRLPCVSASTWGIDDTVEDFDKCSDLLQELLEKLHHVKELKLANCCIHFLLEMRGQWLLCQWGGLLQLPKTPPEGSLLHLKKVKILGFRRVFRAVELVQFLLKNAKVLENMNRYAKGRF
ncbi:hypothetical protein RHSIM_Rhsim07G0017200 [Rhododendron simsii]|uniref:FBD domain-containing protein n=1 Tax=Rhododendron simsii TaxID=118357 RepID=A0A834LFM7_RHOSS|nr:hypothetical protein RHSIM_Rhsim07G0017200 [Rhododendron simsii]